MVVLSNFDPPTDGIIHQESNSSAYVQGKHHGTGTLYIAESRLSWKGEDGQGFSVEYPAISIHAISKDVASFPHQCLYLILDCNLDAETTREEGGNQEEDGGTDDDDEGLTTELRFVPQDPRSLDAMYQAMCAAQELHPDEPDQSDSDAEWCYGDDGAAGDEVAAEQLLQDNPGQEFGGAAAQHHCNNGTGDTGTSGDIADVMDTGQFEDAEPGSHDPDLDQ